MANSEQLKAEVRAFRAAANAVIPRIAGQPEAVNEAVALLLCWQPGAYAGSEVRAYNGIPYKCVQAHDSGPNPHWTPDILPAQWMQYHGTSVETARPYLQPQGAHDAYQTGEYAIEGGATYRCKVNATDRPPSVLPGNWERVGGGATEPDEPTEPDGGDEPVTTPGILANPIPYPTDGSVYKVTNGLYYSYKGKVYLAKADLPTCVWPPDTSGMWQWELVG